MKRFSRSGDELIYLLFLAGMFVCGCSFGRFVALNLSSEGFDAAEDVAKRLLFGNNELSAAQTLLNSLSSVVKIPLLVFFFSVSSFGRLAVGPLFAVRGFLMTFFCGAVSAVTGTSALLVCVAWLLPSCVFSLPCILLLAISGFRERAGNNNHISVLYLLLLIPAVLADMFVCPLLLNIIF